MIKKEKVVKQVQDKITNNPPKRPRKYSTEFLQNYLSMLMLHWPKTGSLRALQISSICIVESEVLVCQSITLSFHSNHFMPYTSTVKKKMSAKNNPQRILLKKRYQATEVAKVK